MKKLLLLSLLSLFSFHSVNAQIVDESASFQAEPTQPPPMMRIQQVVTDGVPQVATAPARPVPMAVAPELGQPRPWLYQGALEMIGIEYLEFLKVKPTDDFATLEPQQQRDCDRRYQTVLNDSKIDIRIAFGYFDWSAGQDIIVQGLNFGMSPSADIGGLKAMEKLLTTPCQGNLQACGFVKSVTAANLYTKQVVIRGQSYAVEVRMSQPSLTEFYKDNAARKEEQSARSQQTKEFYMQALQEADFALYIGHSRNGGGPDFNFPVLKEDGHANYNGYYLPNQFGLKMMIEAFGKSGRQAPIVGIFSCDSRDHFYDRLRRVAPNTGFITSTRVDTYNNLFAASLGGMDALLRGQCQKSFYQSLRLDPEVKELVTMDNMFN